MDDDLEFPVRLAGDEGPSADAVASMRAHVLAEVAKPVSKSDHGLELAELGHNEQEEDPMKNSRWMLVGAAALVIALVIGLIAVTGNDELTPAAAPVTTLPTDDVLDAPPATVPTTTMPASAGTPGADADAGCGLDEAASVKAVVGEASESVTIDVISDASCSGVDIKVVATPWTNGFPIEKLATLDASGSASITDHLLGARRGQQRWSVELLVADSGGVAAVGDFAVTEFCDLEDPGFEVVHNPQTDEVSIMLELDPSCAGKTFTFDNANIFASSPTGGWETYTVDATGRIEVVEQLVVPGPIIDVLAIEVAAERGINTGHIARVTLDIGG